MAAPQDIRLLFDKAWAASEIIYNKADNLEERRQRVANIIGGQVACNVTHQDPKLSLTKKGIILFEVSGWSDATGHATLFNGYKCYDSCYFNEPESTYIAERANFWSLL
ncbi:T6SS effector amidase Tae4 family protein [Snodgrassella gandavensis]|uniref:T6SS effector amidase Tae4 family protein n=1 Tax=Snodgrassella gandavensis TaxID=2946698 RepID=UPI001EF41CCF|nr:T6SS effector amidase Tae4 family protein [Snodgrassella gandavensis]